MPLRHPQSIRGPFTIDPQFGSRLVSKNLDPKEGEMYSRPWRIFLIGLLLLGAAAAAGYYGYQAGVARGVAEGVAAGAPPADLLPFPAYGHYYYPRPFGFGLLGCLVPLFFVFLFFGVLRGAFWRSHWGWGMGSGHHGPHGMEGKEVPPMFREWHRRAHEPAPEGESGTNKV
jgi:hypothetical protein